MPLLTPDRMTDLIPTRYSEKANSTFFDVAGLLITVGYEVVNRRSWFVLPGESLARINVNVGDGAAVLTHNYVLPRNRRVGAEISDVERGLYGFLDEIVRATVQVRALESAARKVEAQEAEHLYGGVDRPIPGERNALAASEPAGAAEKALTGDLIGKLITAFQHLTNVTSLSRVGLTEYQGDRAYALQKIVESSSLTSALRVQGIVQAVEAFLLHEVEATTDIDALRERTLDYLAMVAKRGSASISLGSEQAHVIVNDFVPAYVKMRQEFVVAGAYPSNVIEHAFGSFFGGGIAGYLTLSVFGEMVIRGLTGTAWDLPGWYIGAAVAFVWPYLRASLGRYAREEKFDRKREALVQRINTRLRLTWPEE